MNKRTLNVVMLSVFMASSVIMALVAVIRVPAYLAERMRLIGLQNKLDNQITAESQLKAFQESFIQEAATLRASVEARLSKLTMPLLPVWQRAKSLRSSRSCRRFCQSMA